MFHELAVAIQKRAPNVAKGTRSCQTEGPGSGRLASHLERVAPKGPMRTLSRRVLRVLAAVPLVVFVGCSSSSEVGVSPPSASVDQAFASAHGVLLDFEFDGQMSSTSSSPSTLKSQITSQLTYTVGQLNGDRSVGRFERLELTNVVATPTAAGGFDVTYHAKLPVAWGRLSAQPTTYVLKVPLAGTTAGIDAWVATYNTSCIGFEGSGSDRYSFWYYYRPSAAACALSAADTAMLTATVTRSPENTVGKYPEYDKIWSDRELDVVAMFGRNESGATASSDAGIRDFNTFVSQARSYVRTLQPDVAKITETPGISNTPGVALPQVTVSAILPLLPGETIPRKIKVNVMLVGYRIYQDGATFDAWYDALTPTADLVLYAGHAGLGENVRTLMNKGVVGPGQYTIWMVNGCDTFAYVDPTLANRVSAANGGASATRYLDTVSNAMPSYFTRTPGGSMSMIRALMDVRAPKTYPQVFANIDPAQIVVVTGEEDNLFDPSMSVIPGVPPGPVVVDAGVPVLDSGLPPRDGGVTTDAGRPTPDGGAVPAMDAGPSPQTTPPIPSSLPSSSPSETGCACETAPGRSGKDLPGASLMAFGGLGAFLVRRRRPRR
jgi:hypothetical protein